MNDKTLSLVLRVLAIRYRNSGAENLAEFDLTSRNILDIIENLGGGMGGSVRIIKALESKRFVRVTVPAGQGSAFTRFVLTEEGYKQAFPPFFGSEFTEFKQCVKLFTCDFGTSWWTYCVSESFF